MAKGKRPAPFRTRKLSPSAPMVLRGRPRGRVGHRRTSISLWAATNVAAHTHFQGASQHEGLSMNDQSEHAGDDRRPGPADGRPGRQRKDARRPSGGTGPRGSGTERGNARAPRRSSSGPGHSPRAPKAGPGGDRANERFGAARASERRDRPPEPSIDEDVTADQLDRQARARLRTLSKLNA